MSIYLQVAKWIVKMLVAIPICIVIIPIGIVCFFCDLLYTILYYIFVLMEICIGDINDKLDKHVLLTERLCNILKILGIYSKKIGDKNQNETP